MRSVVRLLDGSVGVAVAIPDSAKIEFSPGDPRRPDFAEVLERGEAPRFFANASEVDEVLEEYAVELVEPEPLDEEPVTAASHPERRLDDILRLRVLTGV